MINTEAWYVEAAPSYPQLHKLLLHPIERRYHHFYWGWRDLPPHERTMWNSYYDTFSKLDQDAKVLAQFKKTGMDLPPAMVRNLATAWQEFQPKMVEFKAWWDERGYV